MDFTLRCNSLKCRTELVERAVATTCSHIFCLPCSDTLGISSKYVGGRNCPACETPLLSPDDVATVQLSPSDDSRGNVLHGLSPNVIMECAGRGLAFWSYQTIQEIIYQEHLVKSLKERNEQLKRHLEVVVRNANSEIEQLNHKVSKLEEEKDKLSSDSAKLGQALRDKTKKQRQTQEQYDTLKRKQLTEKSQSTALMTREFSKAMPHTVKARDELQDSKHSIDDWFDNMGDYQAMPPPMSNLGQLNPSQDSHNLLLDKDSRNTITPQKQYMGGASPHLFLKKSPAYRSGTPKAFGRTSHQSFQHLLGPLSEAGGHKNRRISNGYGLSAGMRRGSQSGHPNSRGFL